MLGDEVTLGEALSVYSATELPCLAEGFMEIVAELTPKFQAPDGADAWLFGHGIPKPVQADTQPEDLPDMTGWIWTVTRCGDIYFGTHKVDLVLWAQVHAPWNDEDVVPSVSRDAKKTRAEALQTLETHYALYLDSLLKEQR